MQSLLWNGEYHNGCKLDIYICIYPPVTKQDTRDSWETEGGSNISCKQEAIEGVGVVCRNGHERRLGFTL